MNPTRNQRDPNGDFQLDPLLTLADLAGLLRVHKRTVARMCRRGEIPQPLKVGGSLRWKISDVVEMLDALDAGRRTGLKIAGPARAENYCE